MYAGVFTLNKGDFFYCEEQPCTAPLPGWFIFVFLVKLKFIYWLSSDWFHSKQKKEDTKNSPGMYKHRNEY